MVAPSQIAAVPYWCATGYKGATITPATGTGSTTLITGVAGQAYFVTEWGYQVSVMTTVTGGANVGVIFTDSVFGTVANFIFWAPNTFTAPNSAATLRQVAGPGLVWVCENSGSSLSVALDTTLTAGLVRAFARYGFQTGVGE